MTKKSKKSSNNFYSMRFYFVIAGVSLLFVLILLRSAQLQVLDFSFLRSQGDARILRKNIIPAYRGIITDRNGADLAISIPVDSIWVNPKTLIAEEMMTDSRWKQLAVALKKDPEVLKRWVIERKERQFAYMKRHVEPEIADFIRRLNMPGVDLIKESKRFYPSAEVAAHVVGFTGIEDHGLEGIERSFDQWLSGTPGSEWVTKDRLGRVVEQKGIISPMEPGKNLELSIDLRIQTVAYRELKRTIKQYQAQSGALVVLDIHTGEVLAMANQPSFNPNRLDERLPALTRNRAVNDVFEPGSAAKPFTVLSALESGKFFEHSIVDTSPGTMRIGGSWVRDERNYGKLKIPGVLRHSSNVGTAKIALNLETDEFLHGFYAVGFGLETGSGFPGESNGIFKSRTRWSKFEKAALSYGYGLSVTALQLARAYAVLGNGGYLVPVSLLKRQDIDGRKHRVIAKENAEKVLGMLEDVVSEKGTGRAASVSGYRVAGKTGTIRKAEQGGYGSEYGAIFSGIAPLGSPRLALVIMIDRPGGDYYYGGEVAAPTFAKVMRQALRVINAVPDKMTLIERSKSLDKGRVSNG